MLPEINAQSQMAMHNNMAMGYETHQAAAENVPRFGGGSSKRIATGNAVGRPTHLQPLVASGAGGRAGAHSVRAAS